jgi:hypothetical protein
MTLAAILECLARALPGIAGYQEKETSRDADKALRVLLATKLDERRRELEEAMRELTRAGALASLPVLDRVAAKLDQLANTIRYASRGYRGVFDAEKIDGQALERMREFDTILARRIDALAEPAGALTRSLADAAARERAVQDLWRALGAIERELSMRQALAGRESDDAPPPASPSEGGAAAQASGAVSE